MSYLEVIFDLDQLNSDLKEISKLANQNDLWENPENAKSILQKKESLQKQIDRFNSFQTSFNDDKELMLQQRAASKYHSPLLWTNTCCSHQRDGETSLEAGKRRLQEEMGFVCELEEVFSFLYKAEFDNGLTEHELDHVMIGSYNDNPEINREEVEAYKWMKLMDVKTDIEERPENYTAWFKIIFEKSYEKIATHELLQ